MCSQKVINKYEHMRFSALWARINESARARRHVGIVTVQSSGASLSCFARRASCQLHCGDFVAFTGPLILGVLLNCTRYSTIEKEMLAIVFALEKWH